MKYRIVRAAKKPDRAPAHRIFRLCASQTLSRMARHHEETIDFARLFEISDLPDLPRERRPHPLFAAIRTFFLAVIARVSGLVRRSVARLREKAASRLARIRAKRDARRQRKKRESLYWLAGALCSSLCVTLLFALVVAIRLLGGYGGVYRVATVPSLVGTVFDETIEEDDRFSFVVDYQVNPDVPVGYVISQSPQAGVTRRIYGKGKPCTVTLTVSCATPRYALPEFVGQHSRDAILTLRNHGISYTLESVYSDTVPAGTVLSQSITKGSLLSAADSVALTVSRGPMRIVSAVPSLIGLSEMQASSLLSAAGLVVGEVTYVPSDRPVGTILSQDEAPSSLLEQGGAVSFTVSAGYSYATRGVPSLYGLSVAEATARLREYGLVLGTVTRVSDNPKGGTIVAQSPLPDTPITSAIVSVDVYLGS